MNAVLAATPWHTNADMITACTQLGYLPAGGRILDPTHGRGLWWTNGAPDPTACQLVCADLRPGDPDHRAADDFVQADFRSLPFASGTFDAVTYDPPYVCVGGRRTTGMPDMHDRYGLTDAPTSPAGLQVMINAGLTEVHRVLKPNGHALVKCQDYVSSGRLWIGTHWTLTHAIDLGFEPVDRLEHIGTARPQPSGRRQVHARRNLSTLFVLRKGRAA